MKDFKQLLKEASGQTVGIMFGRFNPPHKGHKAAWQMASENDRWYVGTNKSTQGKKDPLPYDVKIKAMEALWPEVASHIVPETNLFTLAAKVYGEVGEGANLIVYTDEDWLTQTLVKYNGQEGKHGYYNFANISNKPTPRLSSATDVRNAVLADDREAFEKAAGVPADFKIDGKDFFDLVAEYLKPLHESRLDEVAPLILAALGTAVRVGAPAVLRLLGSQTVKQGAKQVAKGAVRGTTNVGKAVVKNPGKSAAAYGGYQVYSSVQDALEWLKEFKLDGALATAVAKVMVKHALPAAGVAAALYGGYKLADYLKNNKNENLDKYNEQDNLKESQMDINALRKLAGLHVDESAPVAFEKKPGYEMTDVQRKLAGIGQLLMQNAESEKDEQLSNAMSALGGSLADGNISTTEDLVSFIRDYKVQNVKGKGDVPADPSSLKPLSDQQKAALSDATTKAIAAYNNGERASGLKPGEQPEDDFVEPESDEEMMDSVDLSDIRGEYGIEEGGMDNDFNQDSADLSEGGPDEPSVSQMSDEDLAAYIGTSVEDVKADRDAAEEAANDMARDHMESVDANKAVAETTQNAMNAAMAELRKLAGL